MRSRLVVALAASAFLLSGCGAVYEGVSSIERREVDGVDCVVYTGAAGGVAVSCDWESAT